MPPPAVTVERAADGQWQLTRGGSPYAVRGAGAHTRYDELAAAGATSFRTWGVNDETAARLDRAHELGMTVSLGLWLGHVEHGFDWSDDEQLATQREAVRRAVLAYRDHPALLIWGIGNEMELDNDDPAMWREVGAIVRMVRELDPLHPTMVVTAELGEANADRLRTYVPAMQIWGINTYGGIASLSERLDEVGWDRPFVVTELGSRGDWESPTTPWGAPVEPTSTEKSAAYRDAIAAVRDDPRCVGTYAFVWNRGSSPADTWFSLLGPGNVRYEPTDALVEIWSGTPPPDRAPSVVSLDAPFAGTEVAPGAPLRAQLEARDPEAGPLRYAWVMHRDTLEGSGVGSSVDCREGASATLSVTAPDAPGAWRLLAVAIDRNGGAAYASARFHVEGVAGPTPSFPFWVHGPWAPSGWMGDASERVRMRECPPRPGFCQGPCQRFEYRGDGGEHGWAAVGWMHPHENWQGRRSGVAVPPGARAVELTAWGARGGERVTFSVGNWEVDGFSRQLEDVVLEATPTPYRIELDAGVREEVVYGFTWAATDPGPDGMAFHVADVRWVAE